MSGLESRNSRQRVWKAESLWRVMFVPALIHISLEGRICIWMWDILRIFDRGLLFAVLRLFGSAQLTPSLALFFLHPPTIARRCTIIDGLFDVLVCLCFSQRSGGFLDAFTCYLGAFPESLDDWCFPCPSRTLTYCSSCGFECCGCGRANSIGALSVCALRFLEGRVLCEVLVTSCELLSAFVPLLRRLEFGLQCLGEDLPGSLVAMGRWCWLV